MNDLLLVIITTPLALLIVFGLVKFWKPLVKYGIIEMIVFFTRTSTILFFTIIFLNSLLYLLDANAVVTATLLRVLVCSTVGLIAVLWSYSFKVPEGDNFDKKESFRKKLFMKLPYIITFLLLVLLVWGWYLLFINWNTDLMVNPLLYNLSNMTGGV